jgi:glutathione-dependent peroxiredoxin
MKFVIFSKDDCQWCTKAKILMNDHDVSYIEKKLGIDYTRDELRNLVPDGIPLTVPQIFSEGRRIGGYEHLVDFFEKYKETLI